MIKKRQTGKTIISGNVYLDDRELEVASFLPLMGTKIEFIVPSRRKGAKSPDVMIDGIAWEIKSPIGQGKYTLERAFKVALKQSKNVIFNLRKCKTPTNKAIAKLTKEFQRTKSAKRLVVITKAGKLIDISK